MIHQSQRQSADKAVVLLSAQVGGYLVECAATLGSCRRCPARVELVQVQAQSADDAGALSNEVFTMIDQQPEVALDSIEARYR